MEILITLYINLPMVISNYENGTYMKMAFNGPKCSRTFQNIQERSVWNDLQLFWKVLDGENSTTYIIKSPLVI
jgi:hypothetical protein